MAGTTFQASAVARFYFVSTIADITAPTVAEVAAGTELTCDIREYSGFMTEQTFIDDPSGCTKLVGKTAGQQTLADSDITFKMYLGDATDNPLWSTLAQGTEGYIVHCLSGATGTPVGDKRPVAAGDVVNVWDVQVAAHSHSTPYSNDLASWVASFAVFSGAIEVDVAA